MRFICWAFIAMLFFCSCQKTKEISSLNPVNWEKRSANATNLDNLSQGSTYLAVYSQIYQQHENKTYNLPVTVSLRNVSQKDTAYILKADYNNSKGERIRSYFKTPIYIAPLETIEIVIDEVDNEGGTGGNFIFDWAVYDEKNLPLFEAVMISTSGQQGLSFLTRGVRIYE